MGRPLLVMFLLAGFAGAATAQDATGLGGLPQGKATATVRTKMLSLSPSEVWGSKMVPAGVLGAAPAPGDRPSLEILRHEEPAHSSAGSAKCENNSSNLCYDAADRHIVYRPARMLMPPIKGMTAENISVRRDGIRLKYSFP
jgi:hypothetical protein